MISVNGDLDLHFQGQLFVADHHFYESLEKIGHIIVEIQQYLKVVTLTYIFKLRRYYFVCCRL